MFLQGDNRAMSPGTKSSLLLVYRRPCHSGHRLYFGSCIHSDGCILIFDLESVFDSLLELWEAVQEVKSSL